MRQLKTIVVGLILIGQSCSGTDQFKALLKSPDKFQFQEVEITGVFHDQFEDHAIYLKMNGDKKNAIWINFSELLLSLNTFNGGLDGQTIKVRGIFNGESKGHLGQYAGCLENAFVIEME